MIPTEMQRLTKYPLLLQSIAQNTGTPRPLPLRSGLSAWLPPPTLAGTGSLQA